MASAVRVFNNDIGSLDMALPPKDLHLKCLKCGAALAAGERFCSNCGADRDLELAVHAFTAPALASARRWILILGIAYLLNALVLCAMIDGPLTRDGWLVVGSTIALAAIHGGLWLWARSQPLAAAVVALALFVTLQLAIAVTAPEDLYKGFLIKALFLVSLVGAVRAGHRARRIRAEHARARGATPAFDLYTRPGPAAAELPRAAARSAPPAIAS
jgi:hypothetical protein